MKKFLKIFVALLAVSAMNAHVLAANNSYSCDFENEADRSRWVLNPAANSMIYGQLVNKWYSGAPGNNSPTGRFGLYISSDNGATNTYKANNAFVVAYDTIVLDHLQTVGDYVLTFDYKGMGDVSNKKDGIYVFWVPVENPEYDPEDASSKPTLSVFSNSNGEVFASLQNYILELQPTYHEDNLNGAPTWRQCSVKLPNSMCDGKPHMLVFAWRNVSAALYQPGGAIDNIQIVDNRGCDAPTDLTLSIEDNRSTLSWMGDADKYEVTIYSYEEDRWYGPTIVSGHSYTISGLTPGQTDFYVRTQCGEDLYSTKAVLNELVYYPDELCVDYLDLNNAKCYISNGNVSDVRTFNNFKVVSAQDAGPDRIESRHTVHYDREAIDPRTRNVLTGEGLKTIPDGELASVRLGNWNNGGEAERIEFSFIVDTINYPVLYLKYAVIIEAPGHGLAQDPAFSLDIMIGGTTIGSCGQALFSATDIYDYPGKCLRPGAKEMGWHLNPLSNAVVWKDWTTVGVNLRDPAYQGKRLTVRLSTFDCAQSAHFGYAYFTVSCGDGKFKDYKCGEINPNFQAPDGFNYRWYYAEDEKYREADGHMPEEYVRGHEQSFNAGYHDDHLYGVDCMFVQDSSCYFTLYASTLATNPISVVKDSVVESNCYTGVYTYSFDASDSYVEEIDHVIGDTLISSTSFIESTEWIFPDGTHSYNPIAEHNLQASSLQDSICSVFLVTRNRSCFDTTELVLRLPKIGLVRDSTLAYLCDAEKEQGYLWKRNGQYYKDYGLYMDTIVVADDCDTILVLDLREPNRDCAVDTTILDNQSIWFHGTEYSKAGVYRYISENCDSSCVLTLSVYQTLQAELVQTVYDVCATDPEIELLYRIVKGNSKYYSLTMNDTTTFPSVYHKPLTVSSGEGVVSIPMSQDVYPNFYSGTVVLHDVREPEYDAKLSFSVSVKYAPSVIAQRWNDVLGIKNADYNGGFEFVDYQWYKNGLPLEGETGANLQLKNNEKFDSNDEYTALVTRSDGVKLFICSVNPDKLDEDDTPYLADPKDLEFAKKVVVRGRLFIQKDGKLFDVVGRVVE